MSLYNMINGVNPATFFILPMLGDKHPDAYPRFRDCFTEDPSHPEYNDHIQIYTRVGGNNRNQDYGEKELEEHPDYIASFDDDFDNTYATYVFKVPEKWKKDFELLKQGKIIETSKEYQNQVRKVFPKLQETFDKLWGSQ